MVLLSCNIAKLLLLCALLGGNVKVGDCCIILRDASGTGSRDEISLAKRASGMRMSRDNNKLDASIVDIDEPLPLCPPSPPAILPVVPRVSLPTPPSIPGCTPMPACCSGSIMSGSGIARCASDLMLDIEGSVAMAVVKGLL